MSNTGICLRSSNFYTIFSVVESVNGGEAFIGSPIRPAGSTFKDSIE